MEKQAQIKAHARAIAALLYKETDPEKIQTLEGIEEAVRDHILEHVSPEIGGFLSKLVAEQMLVENASSQASSES